MKPYHSPCPPPLIVFGQVCSCFNRISQLLVAIKINPCPARGSVHNNVLGWEE